MVKNGLIFGGGRQTVYTNIVNFAVTGEAGNDEFVILSTNPEMSLSVYGGLGSDVFKLTPREVSPAYSKNQRGHRGIIKHTATSSIDVGYDGLIVRGVEANVMDNDGDYGWIYNTDDQNIHLMTEDGNGEFSFYLYPTTLPEGDLFVKVVAPAARDEQRYVFVNDKISDSLVWSAGDMSPREVHVTYNPDVSKLDNMEITLMLNLFVELETLDYRFINTEQAVLPVSIVLLPSIQNTAGAKSVFVKQSSGGTKVAEGSNGFESSYDVYLRPCSDEMLSVVQVEMSSTVQDQISITPSELVGSDFDNGECKATVTVAAVDDNIVEGEHYTTIFHTVRNSTDGNVMMLTNESPVYVSNVLVTIYDDDTPGYVKVDTIA